jgi:hypothetical protein
VYKVAERQLYTKGEKIHKTNQNKPNKTKTLNTQNREQKYMTVKQIYKDYTIIVPTKCTSFY